ncbi:hypothetical protein [Lunatibacter salilacus]|uniref:hypothetical protein n=1 Tax=Lunatibacter salilacus TaxID=2483804 RepID=UPI00131E38EF|nr:hypothetical protein [Lunatibacter salilacus]
MTPTATTLKLNLPFEVDLLQPGVFQLQIGGDFSKVNPKTEKFLTNHFGLVHYKWPESSFVSKVDL